MSKPNHPTTQPAGRIDRPGTVTAILPARNEEQALPLVLRDLPRGCIDRVLVVDNGSTDATARVARAAGAEVLTETRPGYGRACLRGLAALSLDPPDIVVFLDADHSDHPEELPQLIDPVRTDQADLVLGSRTLGASDPGAHPWHARLGNRLAVFLIRILYGHRYTDLGPMRAIRYRNLMQLGMRDRGYGWTAEMQVRAIRQRLRVREVPVRYRRRVGRSKVSGTVRGSLGAGGKILWTIVRLRLSRR